MNLPPIVTDNVSEVLVKIIEFTQFRQKVLTRNINNLNKDDYIPKDVAVDEFSNLLNEALSEHIRTQRLLLRDTENIKFGTEGTFEAKPIIDEYSLELLDGSRDKYLEHQINKLLENSLNQRVAAELLKQKQGMVTVSE
jgi:flagellar basal body rod protein FlgB